MVVRTKTCNDTKKQALELNMELYGTVCVAATHSEVFLLNVDGGEKAY